jgi:hypothetical protein
MPDLPVSESLSLFLRLHERSLLGPFQSDTESDFWHARRIRGWGPLGDRNLP